MKPKTLKCPHCDHDFTIADPEYDKIASQIRTIEFNQDVADATSQIIAQQRREHEFAIESLTSKHEAALQARMLEFKDAQAKLLKQIDDQKTKTNMLIERHRLELELKDEQINMYRDFKARQSVKTLGESLEQYCFAEFNKYRMLAFPDAYFEKDNDIKHGNKGDFIFRDYDDGLEYLSIMFEMKNEFDTTKTKHKNEDFFKKLDNDRKDKNCEYAVLVSTLESDNDFYNQGIVDVSHIYPKMYVIRPQFFIAFIGLLRNAAKNSLSYQRELLELKNQQIDIFNFENNLDNFKSSFSHNYDMSSKRFSDALLEIDKIIDYLERLKDDITIADNNIRIAKEKLDNLSIKKLAKNSPDIKNKICEKETDI